jgi:hypothetical protein
MISKRAYPRLRLVLPLVFGAVAAGALLLRIPSIAEPLGIDQSLWASAARGMSRGQLLYRDVWEQRPPGIYWVYVAGFNLLGWTSSTVAWLDILSSAATTILIYAIVRALSSTTTAALAAAMYAALTMPAWLYGHGGFLERSVSETFIAVCVSAAAWCAVKLRERGSLPYAVGMGLFAGAAVVFKPNAALYFPALAAWVALFSAPGLRTRTFAARTAAAAIAAAAVLPAVTLFWLWRLDLLHDARVAVVDFNRYYVGQGFVATLYAVDFAKAVWLRIKTEPLWLAGSAGAVIAAWQGLRTRSIPPLAALAVVWGAAAALVIVVNGARLFNSYFINAHAPLAILGAWFLGDAWRGSRARGAIAAATAVLMCALLVQRGYGERVFGRARMDLEALRGRTDWQSYLEAYGGYANDRGYSARANAELADYIRAHTGPEDSIFLLGINGAGVYFASDRLAAHRFLRVNFFVDSDFPNPDFHLDAVVADLLARRPRYLIFERLHSRSAMGAAADSLPANPALAPLLAHYRRETVIEDFTLYRALD